MLLIAGLGNPGKRYARHRHNIGFMVADEIVRHHGFGPWRQRFQSEVSEGHLGGEKILVLKPQTYMNESGQALSEALRFYKLEPEDVIAMHDELDLAPAKVRVKRGGGAGGHNGLRSLDSHIGRSYRRIRLGIGHPGDRDLVHGYVLHDFAKSEEAWVEKLCDAVAKEFPRLVEGDDAGFMSRIAHIMNPPRKKGVKSDSKDAAKKDVAPQPGKTQRTENQTADPLATDSEGPIAAALRALGLGAKRR